MTSERPVAPLPLRTTVPRRSLLAAGAATGGLFALSRLLPVGPAPRASAADTKTASTYYTAEKVAQARANVESLPWAAESRDRAVAAAARYLELSDDELWSLVPGQRVGRSLGVLIRYQQRILGSPGPEGAKINEYGNYPWLIDQFAHPWKIQSPVTGELYPSNDFASYYAAGLDEHGEFDPDLARANGSQYLVNELYPERGEGWGVDDGTGWTDPDGNVWTFIAYYCHWGLWTRTSTENSGLLYTALEDLRNAYLYTGDARYAHKGMVLLDRIADVYPAMDVTAFPWDEGYDNGDPAIHSAQGKTVNDIWETSVARNLVYAYDAFWPAIAEDPELIAFVAAKAEQYGIDTPKATAADLRTHIEDHVVAPILQWVKDSQIRGNTGMHQTTLALAAVVLDRAGQSEAMLDFCFQPGGLEVVKDPAAPYGRRYVVTGGDLGRMLVDEVDRDGWGNESAPGYNIGWLNALLPMAGAVDGYQRYPDYDLYNNVKFRRMFSSAAGITMLSAHTPTIGDSGKTGNPGLTGSASAATTGFVKTGDPLLAQYLHLQTGGDLSDIHGSIFDADPEGLRDEVAAVIEEHGPFNLPTTHQAGYGFSGLRAGQGGHARGVWMYYGRSSGHGHRDCLNLGVHGAGMDLAPDLGYPEVTGTDPERRNWTAATVSHNTVVVDESSQQPQWVGTPTLLGSGAHVSVTEVEAAHCYPQVSRYRRTVALVTIDDEASYAVDTFRVRGGSSHVFSFHGGPGGATSEGLGLVAQEGGSYAGPDVPFQDPDYNSSALCGFNYLNRVERDEDPAATWSVDWAVRDQWDVHETDPDAHLRLTMLTQTSDVALADGIPPRNKPGNPDSLRYVLARRTGTDLDSTFSSVIEPYVGSSRLRSVRQVEVAGQRDGSTISAVRVELTNGLVDYVVSSLDDSRDYIVDRTLRFRGRFGVLRMDGDTVVMRHLHGASHFDLFRRARPGPAALRGTVAAFTEGLELENEIVLALTDAPADLGSFVDGLSGSWVHVEPDGGDRNGSYQITAAEALDAGRIRLDLAGQTLVRSLADPQDSNGGHIHNIAVGAAAEIPLTVED